MEQESRELAAELERRLEKTQGRKKTSRAGRRTAAAAHAGGAAAADLKAGKARRRKWVLPIIITVLAVAAAAAAAVAAISMSGRLQEDRNAKKLSEEVRSREELRAELQRQADGSNFRVKLNTAPVSEDGKTADLCVVNSVSNHYDMQVVITTEDGTEVYKSDLLAPGDEELMAKLSNQFQKGTYPATAVAYALDRESGERLGEVTVDITLTVSGEKK